MADRENSLTSSNSTSASEVEETLKIFADCFAKQFEESLDEYFEIGRDKKKKAGKTFRWIANGISVFGSLGKAAASGVRTVGYYVYKQTAIAISNNPCFTNQFIVRESSVKAAVSIFISYECQFMYICKNSNPKFNLEIISEDAVERFFNYYNTANRSLPKHLTSDAIIEGVIFGKSKKVVPLLPMMDNEVNNINVADLFEKVGLVTLDSNGNPKNYYSKRGGRYDCGFRRLSAPELAKIETALGKALFFNVDYHKLPSRPRGNEYKYVLQLESFDKYSEDVLTVVNQEDPKSKWQTSDGNILRKRKWFGVSDLTSVFIGRKEEEKRIADEIKSKTVVVYGLPGVGKSELALKFAHAYYNENDSVLMINAETKLTATAAFHELHTLLECQKVDENENEEIALKKMIQNVYETIDGENILFIFDGAENFKQINMFLPISPKSKKINVLITTTIVGEWEKLRGNWELIPLTNFSDVEALTFIAESLRFEEDEHPDAVNLAKLLSNFPLALLQAICYIKEQKENLSNVNINFKIKDYIEIFNIKEQELLYNEKFKSINDIYDKTTFTALKIGLEKIMQHSEAAKTILDMISYLAPNNISIDIICKVENDLAKLGNAINLLKQYSIVKLENGLLSIHGLIQRVNKLELKESTNEENVLRSILERLNGRINNKNFEKILPHVVSVWNHACEYSSLIQNFIANIGIAESDVIPYLHLICRGSSYKTVEEILNKIEDSSLIKIVNVRDNTISRRTPVHYVAVNGDPKLLQLLVENGAKTVAGKLCKIKARSNWTPLHLAAQFGNLEMVEALTELIDIDVSTKYKFTPLILAAKNGYLDIVLFLINKGANVKAADKQGFTALHYAVKNNHIEVVQILLEKVVDINAKTSGKNSGKTPLHIAARNGNLDIVRVLLDHGATVKIANRDGFTPLHYAAYYNHLDIVKEFLGLNIDGLLDCVTSDGKTALDLAKEKGNKEIEELLNEKIGKVLKKIKGIKETEPL